jgi:hypothetical protein
VCSRAGIAKKYNIPASTFVRELQMRHLGGGQSKRLKTDRADGESSRPAVTAQPQLQDGCRCFGT